MAIVRHNWVEDELEIEGRKITVRFNHRIKRGFWGVLKISFWFLFNKKVIGVVESRFTMEELLQEEIDELEREVASKKNQLKGV